MRRAVYNPFTLRLEGIGSCEFFASIPESKAEKLEHLIFYMFYLYIIDTWVLRRNGRKMHDEEALELYSLPGILLTK